MKDPNLKTLGRIKDPEKFADKILLSCNNCIEILNKITNLGNQLIALCNKMNELDHEKFLISVEPCQKEIDYCYKKLESNPTKEEEKEYLERIHVEGNKILKIRREEQVFKSIKIGSIVGVSALGLLGITAIVTSAVVNNKNNRH